MPTSPCGLQDLLAHRWWSHGAVEELAQRVLVVDHRPLQQSMLKRYPRVGLLALGAG
jgi:hypothetical protein